jgi:hypothetical protein
MEVQETWKSKRQEYLAKENKKEVGDNIEESVEVPSLCLSYQMAKIPKLDLSVHRHVHRKAI